METPSSTRRVTRSQTLAALNNSITVSKGNKEESEKSVSKTRTTNGKQQQERSALIDITNDSPIVGLAMETPSSAISKQRSSRAKSMMMMTPGSGEALLRGQVKTLLQKVEEEAELSKVSMESRPFLQLQGCVKNSPMAFLAPTPTNTPQVSNLSDDGGINNSGLGSIVMALPVVEEQLKISEVVSDIFHGMEQEVSLESQKSVITRSLLLDFSELSEASDSSECYSVVTDQGVITGKSSACNEKPSLDDDIASIWSIQVNGSTHDEDDEDPIEEKGDDYCNEEEEEEGDDDDEGLVDELCEGLSKISMKEVFTGKHTRFLYNSDDEIERELEECGIEDSASDNVIRLKGLPTPKGKHLRFPIEEQDA